MSEPQKLPPPVTGWLERFQSADGRTIVSAWTDCCMGVSTTTATFVMRLPDGRYEARVGFAIMGPPQMSEAEFARCDHNPFHPLFRDNYAVAHADAAEKAAQLLGKELASISDGLFADFD